MQIIKCVGTADQARSRRIPNMERQDEQIFVQATLIRKDSDQVVLQTDKAVEIKVPLSKLSDSDVQYLRDQLTRLDGSLFLSDTLQPGCYSVHRLQNDFLHLCLDCLVLATAIPFEQSNLDVVHWINIRITNANAVL